MGRKTTQLELELQAEVDKWVWSSPLPRSHSMQTGANSFGNAFMKRSAFAHDPSSDLGQRYRTANTAAHQIRPPPRARLMSRPDGSRAYTSSFAVSSCSTKRESSASVRALSLRAPANKYAA